MGKLSFRHYLLHSLAKGANRGFYQFADTIRVATGAIVRAAVGAAVEAAARAAARNKLIRLISFLVTWSAISCLVN